MSWFLIKNLAIYTLNPIIWLACPLKYRNYSYIYICLKSSLVRKVNELGGT